MMAFMVRGSSWLVRMKISKNYKIREFHFPDDYQEVYNIWGQSGPGVKVSQSDEIEELQKKIARDPELFLVLENEGSIIGTVIGGFDGRRGMVYHLAVLAEYRGLGLGKMLMEELEKRMAIKGCRKAYLFITLDNDDVLGFYKQMGWEQMPIAVLGKILD